MENKNEKLGAVYLSVDGLNKERFNELTNGMVFYRDVHFLDKYIENYNNGNAFNWCCTSEPEPHAKRITLDELERIISDLPEKEQQPTHFAISPEDYAEYQELKKLKETLKKILK